MQITNSLKLSVSAVLLYSIASIAVLAADPAGAKQGEVEITPSITSLAGFLSAQESNGLKAFKVGFKCQEKELEGNIPSFQELRARNGEPPLDEKTLVPAGSITGSYECTYEGDGSRYCYVVKDVQNGGILEFHSDGTLYWVYHPQENVSFLTRAQPQFKPLPVIDYLNSYPEYLSGLTQICAPASLSRLLTDVVPADGLLQRTGRVWSLGIKTKIEKGPYSGSARYRDFLLDPKLDWQPLKYSVGVSVAGEKLPPDLEITYSDYIKNAGQMIPGKLTAILSAVSPKDRKITKVLQKTEMLHYRLQEVTIEITSIVAADNTDKDKFAFHLPPGTKVVDEVTDQTYIIKDLKGSPVGLPRGARPDDCQPAPPSSSPSSLRWPARSVRPPR